MRFSWRRVIYALALLGVLVALGASPFVPSCASLLEGTCDANAAYKAMLGGATLAVISGPVALVVLLGSLMWRVRVRLRSR